MTTIDEHIAAAEALAAQLERECDLMIEECNAISDEAREAAWRAKETAGALRKVRTALAFARRPRGPMVALELEGAGVQSVEVIKRTTKFVLVFLWNRVERFRLTDGYPETPTPTGLVPWRIAAVDLERIRAMPAGENGVSRALKKLEEKRP